MYYVFNKSSIGYAHIKNKKPCQDYSASYQDNERVIITCCDGHGGAQYVRSQIGSKIASNSIINVFSSVNSRFFLENDIEKVKLLVLCEYNKLVEQELNKKPIRKKDLKGLKEEDIDMLRFNPMKAYGTTLSGAMIYKNHLLVISIGDTEVLGIRKGELVKIFDNSNDPAGNVTYSMCQEDAYKYLRVADLDIRDFDGILLCTDGLSSPYQSYDNFNESFVRPSVHRVICSKSIRELDSNIEKIATKLGVGDDVSLSLILSDKTNEKFYRRRNIE